MLLAIYRSKLQEIFLKCTEWNPFSSLVQTTATQLPLNLIHTHGFKETEETSLKDESTGWRQMDFSTSVFFSCASFFFWLLSLNSISGIWLGCHLWLSGPKTVAASSLTVPLWETMETRLELITGSTKVFREITSVRSTHRFHTETRSQMLVCSSAASPTGGSDVSRWMLSLLYLSTCLGRRPQQAGLTDLTFDSWTSPSA